MTVVDGERDPGTSGLGTPPLSLSSDHTSWSSDDFGTHQTIVVPRGDLDLNLSVTCVQPVFGDPDWTVEEGKSEKGV